MPVRAAGAPRRKCVAAATSLALLALAPWSAPVFAATGDRADARGAATDTAAAIREVVEAEASTATDKAIYVAAAHRALNALVGRGSSEYVETQGSTGDALGALGHVNRLLSHAGAAAWTQPIEGVRVNLTVASRHLDEALKADGVDEFQVAASDALANLQLALGRASEMGALGGLRGSLAWSELGVPEGAAVVSGCAQPSRAPAYGVVKGYLTFVALPLDHGEVRLPQEMGERSLSVRRNYVVIHTPAAQMEKQLCGHAGAQGLAPTAAAAFEQAALVQVAARTDAKPPAGGPALYKSDQAQAGKKIFTESCTSCHGANLQGTGAPAIAGNDFLKTAKENGWSVGDIRYVVVSNMPLNAPHSLSDQQYADVLAYVLASNCYPAGNTAFPTKDTKKLDGTRLGPLTGIKPDDVKLGTCTVK